MPELIEWLTTTVQEDDCSTYEAQHSSALYQTDRLLRGVVQRPSHRLRLHTTNTVASTNSVEQSGCAHFWAPREVNIGLSIRLLHPCAVWQGGCMVGILSECGGLPTNDNPNSIPRWRSTFKCCRKAMIHSRPCRSPL
eukprot:46965-Eustigmatos_ZCMA.PRE.1